MKSPLEKSLARFWIAWRNPAPVHHLKRWQTQHRELDRVVYVVEEFICDGNRSRWNTRSRLEIISGGRAA
jgi:hypothetical protein